MDEIWSKARQKLTVSPWLANLQSEPLRKCISIRKMVPHIKLKIKTKLVCFLVFLAGILLGVVVLAFPKKNSFSGLEIHSVSFSNDDNFIAVASLKQSLDNRFRWSQGGVQIWQVASKQVTNTVCTFRRGFNPNSTVGAFYSKDGQQLIVKPPDYGAGNSGVLVYKSTTLREIKQKASSYASPRCVFWNSSNSAIIEDTEENSTTQVTYIGRKFKITTPHSACFLAIDPTHDRLAIADLSGGVTIYDIKNKKNVSYVTSCKERVPSKYYTHDVIKNMIWLPKYDLLWISNVEGRSILWDSASKEVKASRTFPNIISCAAINHKGDYVAYGTKDGQLKIVPVVTLLDFLKEGPGTGR